MSNAVLYSIATVCVIAWGAWLAWIGRCVFIFLFR